MFCILWYEYMNIHKMLPDIHHVSWRANKPTSEPC